MNSSQSPNNRPPSVQETGDVFSSIDHSIRAQSDQLLQYSDRRAEIITDLDRILTHLRITGNVAGARALYRYLMEGAGNSYSAQSPLSHLLRSLRHLPQNASLLDLGAGPGELVSAWRARGNEAHGIDLSPTFVDNHPHLRMGLIDAKDSALTGIPWKPFDVVTSSLTLDRVAHPKQLIKNMAGATRQGIGVLVTLLPVIPVDDEAVTNPIMYTMPEHRLTDTGTVDGDRFAIREYMADTFGRRVTVKQLEYRVQTSTGEQYYPNTYAFIVDSVATQPQVLSHPAMFPENQHGWPVHQYA